MRNCSIQYRGAALTLMLSYCLQNRSTSISSFLNRTVSFSQLNTDRDETGEEEEEGREDSSHGRRVPDRGGILETSTSNLSKSLTSINTLSSVPHSKLLEDDSHLSMSSGHLDQASTAESALSLDRRHGNHNNDEGEMETAKGGYLGRFTNDRRGELI